MAVLPFCTTIARECTTRLDGACPPDRWRPCPSPSHRPSVDDGGYSFRSYLEPVIGGLRISFSLNMSYPTGHEEILHSSRTLAALCLSADRFAGATGARERKSWAAACSMKSRYDTLALLPRSRMVHGGGAATAKRLAGFLPKESFCSSASTDSKRSTRRPAITRATSCCSRWAPIG
jgi:hypothetical protein